jgi:hypothetical protein
VVLQELLPGRAELVHGDPDRRLPRLVDGLEQPLGQARVDELELLGTGDRLQARPEDADLGPIALIHAAVASAICCGSASTTS